MNRHNRKIKVGTATRPGLTRAASLGTTLSTTSSFAPQLQIPLPSPGSPLTVDQAFARFLIDSPSPAIERREEPDLYLRSMHSLRRFEERIERGARREDDIQEGVETRPVRPPRALPVRTVSMARTFATPRVRRPNSSYSSSTEFFLGGLEDVLWQARRSPSGRVAGGVTVPPPQTATTTTTTRQPRVHLHVQRPSESRTTAADDDVPNPRPRAPTPFATPYYPQDSLLSPNSTILRPPTAPPSPQLMTSSDDPHLFARPPKSYPNPNNFPTPPTYPPVPALVACGSSSTSTRSSAYASPGTGAPLSSNDLSNLGIGLGRFANGDYQDHHHPDIEDDDDAHAIGAAITSDMAVKPPAFPRSSSYHRISLARESSEGSLSRLPLASHSAGPVPNGIAHPWNEGYAASSSSSYEGSPNPASEHSHSQQDDASLSHRARAYSQDQMSRYTPDRSPQDTPPSGYGYSGVGFAQRPRKGTVASSRSESMSGLTSASEDDTDADADEFEVERNDEEEEAARTAAIVVAEEGRARIVHGEGRGVDELIIQTGTTHLLLSSLVSPNSLPALLAPTLPSIASTLLALDISANFLGALPPALAACTQLTELNVASNPLRALPVWLAKLEGLRVLIADATGIATLPTELAALRALNVLSLRRNKLMALPAWLSRLPTLERLELEGNPFQGPWRALVQPLVQASTYTAPPRTPQSPYTVRQQSAYGPGLSVYGSQAPQSAGQGSFMSTTDDDFSAPGSAEPDALRRFVEEEEHTIMPGKRLGVGAQGHLQPNSPSHLPPPSPALAPSSPSHATPVSPTQLPYMSTPPSRAGDRSPVQRAPTFSVRTPSPYLRPLSRTRTTPSRSRLSSGSGGSGSIATFVPDNDPARPRSHTSDGEPRPWSRTSDNARSRTSSAASQRPHTDYAPSRYGGGHGVEDSGYYGSSVEYHAYERTSDASEFFGGGGGGEKEEERRQELRRMRSADELRRALESVIGPSEPMAPEEPPFFVPKLETSPPRPPMMHHYSAVVDSGAPGPVRGVTLTDRPGAKRFASLGATQGLGGSMPTRARPALTDALWDPEGDADAEGEEPSPMGPMIPRERERDRTRDGDTVRPPKAGKSGKWGFLKKMSMGRIRAEPGGRPSTSQGVLTVRSVQTSPQSASTGAGAPRIPRIGVPHADGSPPQVRPARRPTADALNSAPSSAATSHLASGSLSVPSSSPSTPSTLLSPLSQPRSAKRRSFLPLDGPPALNIPIPSTSAFMPDTMIATNGAEEEPPTPAPDSEQAPHDARALRSVMAYLRDMADLGLATSAGAMPMGNPNPSTFNLGSSSPQEGEEARVRRPTLVENGRVLSEGSIPSNASSASLFGSSVSHSEDRGNTMSVATTDSSGSGGKGEEERSKHKDDKTKRRRIIREIVETEQTYVKGLQELIDIYVKPASLPVNTLGNAVASTKETVIPQQERKIVFNGLDSLFSFHKQSFLPSLEQAAGPDLYSSAAEIDPDGEVSMAAAASIANVFVSHAAFMRMYSTYINNFDNAVDRLKQWTVDRRMPHSAPSSSLTSPNSSTAQLAGMSLQMSVVSVSGTSDTASANGVQPLTTSQRKRIKSYLKRCRLNPKHSQLNLEGYLLLPIQRIPRYRLLLEELVRCTPPKLNAYDDPLDRALTEISSLANNMNEGKRDAESRRKLVQWQTRIRGKFPSPLVQPHRRLIMDGPLHLTRVVRKSSMAFDVINSTGDKTNVQVECLTPEETPRSLVGILCNDLLVLCKDPSAGKDHTGSVDLWAVLRMQTLPQPASIVQANALRVVDNKAILYFNAPSTSEALTWCRAINMHIPASKT